MRKAALIGSLLFGALVLQVSIFPWFQFFGSIPEVVMACAILIGIYAGPNTGAAAGFAGGLVQDLFLKAPHLGVAALAFTIVGYGAGLAEKTMIRSSPWMIPAMVLGFALAGGVIQFLAGWITGAQVSVGRVIPAAIYTAVVSVPLSPLVRRICDLFDEVLA